MAKQGISTGTTPNDGSGDSLLDGAVKINSNFDEVYAAIGNGSTVSTPVTSITAGDNITVSGSTGSVTITGIGTADIDTDRINVSGVVTASSFSGSGANLTNLPAAALTGTLPALDGSALTGVTASGVGVTVQDGGSGKGTASIINFGSNLSVTTVNSGIATITAGAANTANLNSDTIVVGVLTATTFGSDLTLGAGRDVVFSSSSGINASTSTENLHWGSGNLYFNSGSPEINWLSGGGNIRVTGAASTISILGGNPAENMAVFKVGGASELYYDNNKKFETTGSGTTTYGTALTQQLNVTGVSTFVGNANFNNVYLGDADKIYLGNSDDLELYHGGSLDNHGYLKSNTGNLYLASSASGDVRLRGYNKDNLIVQSSSVQIFYNESRKFETTEQGVGISGTITVSGQSLVSGISTFESALNADADVTVLGTTDTQQLISSGISTFITGIAFSTGSQTIGPASDQAQVLELRNSYTGGEIHLGAAGDVFIQSYNGRNLLRTNTANVVQGGIKLFYSGSSSSVERLETTNTGVTITGTVVGTAFTGDGSHLVDGKWTLGANGSSDYTFTGIGFTQTTNDPILYLARGRVYEFVNTMGAHPFEIRESAGGSAFDRGVTNNAVSNGTLRFEIPFDAPNTLYYQCTSHSGMGSTIVVYPNTI